MYGATEPHQELANRQAKEWDSRQHRFVIEPPPADIGQICEQWNPGGGDVLCVRRADHPDLERRGGWLDRLDPAHRSAPVVLRICGFLSAEKPPFFIPAAREPGPHERAHEENVLLTTGSRSGRHLLTASSSEAYSNKESCECERHARREESVDWVCKSGSAPYSALNEAHSLESCAAIGRRPPPAPPGSSGLPPRPPATYWRTTLVRWRVALIISSCGKERKRESESRTSRWSGEKAQRVRPVGQVIEAGKRKGKCARGMCPSRWTRPW